MADAQDPDEAFRNAIAVTASATIDEIATTSRAVARKVVGQLDDAARQQIEPIVARLSEAIAPQIAHLVQPGDTLTITGDAGRVLSELAQQLADLAGLQIAALPTVTVHVSVPSPAVDAAGDRWVPSASDLRDALLVALVGLFSGGLAVALRDEDLRTQLTVILPILIAALIQELQQR